MTAARLLEKQWRLIHHFIFHAAFSGRPLRPVKCDKGTLPETLSLEFTRKFKKKRRQQTFRDDSADLPTSKVTALIEIVAEQKLVKAEPQQCSPRGLVTAVVATNPAVVAFPTQQRVRQREKKKKAARR